MKLIKPSYEILTKIDGEKILKNIERAGRTCYKSEDRITKDSAKKFVVSILKSGHESVIEHESISVRIICDRGVTHEIVRHRLASYSQESTRYCNYSKDKFDNQITFIIPNWLHDGDGMKDVEISPSGDHMSVVREISKYIHSATSPEYIWLLAMYGVETYYNKLISSGWSPQQARSVLPNSLKTEIVMTCNVREWRHFFKLRTANVAHPQMREIACPMLDEFKQKIPVIFDDINYE